MRGKESQPGSDGRSASDVDFALITTSYRPDFEQFLELRESVVRHLPGSVEHFVVVPPEDVDQFHSVPGIAVVDESTLIPRNYRRVPYRNFYVSLRRPWWPVRGWILQQALKIGVAMSLRHESVVVVDSDCVFIRDIASQADLRTVARPHGVTAALSRHIAWHKVARSMLGMSADNSLPKPDYVSSVTAWRTDDVRALTSRVEQVCRSPWFDVVAARRHFSEFTLYGVFAAQSTRGVQRWTSRWACEYWDETPLDVERGLEFAGRVGKCDVAIMVSAKSRTPATIRQKVIDRARSRSAALKW